MTIWTVLSSVFAIVLALGFVLALAWGTIFLLKKWQDRQLGIDETNPADASIRFLRSLPLGQRERVTMIEVRGETLLLGITGGSITLLARWPASQNANAFVSELQDSPETDRSVAHLPPRPGVRP